VCEEQGWDKEQGGGMDQKGVLKKKITFTTANKSILSIFYNAILLSFFRDIYIFLHNSNNLHGFFLKKSLLHF